MYNGNKIKALLSILGQWGSERNKDTFRCTNRVLNNILSTLPCSISHLLHNTWKFVNAHSLLSWEDGPMNFNFGYSNDFRINFLRVGEWGIVCLLYWILKTLLSCDSQSYGFWSSNDRSNVLKKADHDAIFLVCLQLLQVDISIASVNVVDKFILKRWTSACPAHRTKVAKKGLRLILKFFQDIGSGIKRKLSFVSEYI